MQAIQKAAPISVEDYLAGERQSQIRHEYIGGVVYAMAGTTDWHNLICGNLLVALRSRLRGKPCRVFTENVKLRPRMANDDIFYYPDLMVTCDARDSERYFKRFPKLLIEVLSPETERIDRHEKFSSYTRIETLEEYVLVAQEKMEVTVFRRANNWRPEVANQANQRIRIPSLDATLSLSKIYEDTLGPPLKVK